MNPPLTDLSHSIDRLETCAPVMVSDDAALVIAKEIERLKAVHTVLARQIKAADRIVELIDCRIEETRNESGRMAMTAFGRERMEALEEAVKEYKRRST